MLPIQYPTHDQYIIDTDRCRTVISCQRSPAGPFDDIAVLYVVDILVNGYPINLNPSQRPNPQINMGKQGVRSLIRNIFAAFDYWGRMYPYTFWAMYDRNLCPLYRTLRRQGVVGDLYGEQWFVFYGMRGQRVLFDGMLNLISGQLYYAPFLWRIAKYSRFYIGELPSPTDDFYAVFEGMD